MSRQSQYITTTLPYVNADPHIGFALEIIQADTLARQYRADGYEVFFNTGTDEHGLKIYRKAHEAGESTQAYVDRYAARFSELKDALSLSYTHFIRTTDSHHISAAQEFWRRCMAAGDIDKRQYSVKYCVGCELEKTDSELVDGRCPLHPNQDLELIEEENYFFRFSAYQERLLQLYDSQSEFVKPGYRLHEIRNFVANGLEDFSISRLKTKMPWGVPVPNDEDHVMYVWFDALVNYISVTGWPEDDASFSLWWPGIQVAGKDNLRQQSAMWQAMLMSAQLPVSQQIMIHGFITANGQKMSKSLGNVIDPLDLVEQYGTDAFRYYLLREIPAFDDGDFSHNRMAEIYNADLANELGNLIMRITNMAGKDNLTIDSFDISKLPELQSLREQVSRQVHSFAFPDALTTIWQQVKQMNKAIDQHQPWTQEPAEREPFLRTMVHQCQALAGILEPFLPQTSATIQQHTSGTITKCPPLFPKS